MKQLALLALLIGTAAIPLSAQDKSAQPAPAAARESSAHKAAKARSGGLPANAVKVSDGVYKAPDASGKMWVYITTPFGYSRLPESQYQADKPAQPPPALRVVSVEGGKVRFERVTPFGKSTWTRPVAELTGDEKAAYEASLDSQKNDKQ